jgi:RND family efflux transporter MFP subunit
MGALKTSVKIVVPILLIALAIGIGRVIIKTTKKPERKRPARTAYAVKVVPLKANSQVVKLRATGTVTPSTVISLRSRVAGEIVEVSSEFIAGGRYNQGDLILRLDPVDYQLALEQRKASLAEAEFQLKLEEGQRVIAAREWELIASDGEQSGVDHELATRVPHLKYRKAKRDAAKADLDKAELNLKRTEIRAPFNAIVVERRADQGAQVSLQDTIAVLAGSDRFYVRASVPLDRLQWITCHPETGSMVTITRGTGMVKQGRVVRLESSLEPLGRMARVLIAVDNPLAGEHPILLNEYVRIEIEGKPIEGAYRIPRVALHDDRFVWLATSEKTLEVREVSVVWRDAADVIISGGLEDGEQLILTNLSTPISGMALRIAGEPESPSQADASEERKAGKGRKHDDR